MDKDVNLDLEENIPVIMLRGVVVFPGSVLHFDVARSRGNE